MKKTFKVSMILPVAVTTAVGILVAVLITAFVGMMQVRSQVYTINAMNGRNVQNELNEKVAVEIAVNETMLEGIMTSFRMNGNKFDIPFFAEMVESMFLKSRDSALCVDVILFNGYFVDHPIVAQLRNDLNNVSTRVIRDRVGNISRNFLPAEDYRNGEWYTKTKESRQMQITTPRLTEIAGYGNIYVFEISYPFVFNDTFIGAISFTYEMSKIARVNENEMATSNGENWFAVDPTYTFISHTQEKYFGTEADDYFGPQNVRNIQKALKENKIFTGSLRYDGASWVATVFPLQLGTTEKEGFVGCAMPTIVLIKSALIPLLAGLAIGIIILVVVITIIYILNNRLAKYIISLKDTAIEIAGGNYKITAPRVPFSSKDNELVIFGEELVKMIESIRYKEKVVTVIANKDLTMNIDLASDKDELGKILKGLQAALTDFFVQTDIAVNQVKNGSQQIADASQSQSQGATEQASAVEEISASLHEINVQSKNNADKSDEANKYAKSAADYARAGNEKMNVLLGLMDEISQASDQTKAVVKAIDEIAFQTNLLALNANVEAARAGKYGRGFGVVAEEVRNLAKKSAQSVLETQAIVDTIISKVQESVQFANDTSKQLSDILKESDVTSQYLQEIAVASKEQSQGIEQISKAIGQIEQVTQSNSANAEEGAAAAEELAAQAVQLHSMLEEIKFERNTTASQTYAASFVSNAHQTVMNSRNNADTAGTVPSSASVIKLDDSDYGNF